MLLKGLKAETAVLHAAVEAEIGLGDPGLDRSGYVAVLKRLYGFHAGLEPRLAAALGDEGFLAPRRRLPALARDLAALGSRRPATAGDFAGGPAAGDADAAFGVLYVLEGSRLGGPFVARLIERRLGLSDGVGYSYFAASGRETGALWRGFSDRLGARAPGSSDDRIVTAAIRTFEAFRSFVCRRPDGETAWPAPLAPI